MSIADLFGRELVVVNVGLEQFATDLQSQGIRCVQLDWRPPAQGDQEAADLLNLLLS